MVFQRRLIMQKSFLLFFLSFLTGWLCGRFVFNTVRETVYDTIVMTDSIPYIKPMVKDSTIIKYNTVKLPADTIHKEIVVKDSVNVVVPITQAVYADSTYKAWVSGYNPCLDSIRIFTRTNIIRANEQKPPKHWHIGASVGCGMTTSGVQPFVGISITYSLISL